jgi:hypothetical protein
MITLFESVNMGLHPSAGRDGQAATQAEMNASRSGCWMDCMVGEKQIRLSAISMEKTPIYFTMKLVSPQSQLKLCHEVSGRQ